MGHLVQPAGAADQIGGLDQPTGPVGRLRAQFGSAHQRGHRGVPTATPNIGKERLLQRVGHRLVRAGRGFGQMPRSRARVVGHVGQSPVRQAALGRRGQLHDRRADQRRAKRHTAGDQVREDQAGPSRRLKVIDIHATRGLQEHGQARMGLQCGQQQQLPGRCGQALDRRGERGLQPPGQRQEHGQRLLATALPVGQRHEQLAQRERVTGSLVEQPPPHRRCQLRIPGVQQGSRRLLVEWADILFG